MTFESEDNKLDVKFSLNLTFLARLWRNRPIKKHHIFCQFFCVISNFVKISIFHFWEEKFIKRNHRERGLSPWLLKHRQKRKCLMDWNIWGPGPMYTSRSTLRLTACTDKFSTTVRNKTNNYLIIIIFIEIIHSQSVILISVVTFGIQRAFVNLTNNLRLI